MQVMRVVKIAVGIAGLGLALSLFGQGALQAQTSTQTVSLQPGSTLNVNCPTTLTVTRAADKKSAIIKCAAPATPTKTATKPAATATKAPATATQAAPTATQAAPTATQAAPTATQAAPTATQVHQHPTATPGASATAPASGLAPVDPIILGTCPAEVHDRYTVVGPNGKVYRTWHPQRVPLDANNPNGPSCLFAHEHGDDPRTSLANPSLPPFGYIADVTSHPVEAHEGFKVFVVNRGTVNDEGRTARTHSRVVAHMGTGGVKRFTMEHHSLMFDLKAVESSHYVSVQGLATTKEAGSICQRDAGQPIGRTVVTIQGTGCDLGSLYEIWAFEFSLQDGGQDIALVMASTAAFDPITVMNPADRNELIYAWDARAYPEWGQTHGCDREAYHGPVYWYNQWGPTEYYTDGFGNVTPGGPLKQVVSQHNGIGIPMSPDQSLFKHRQDACALGGLGLKN